ncbi:hypothetical protein Back11_36950 [Paenibacillus baekrokdamisoli]|uniref:Uncharacterized protein n=1 Tax=Paenibacillus baekrokdamisoli TaxID=1712516 RepID=A0A3G9IU00_9BACL|nr:DUF6526 family protein [Paenibacillus baekrokdamisoli]MBB3072598.1 hypothetical protein [Paenibacillus baekrokdamisoli]BBH22350.1 hypothetical protein Back11_36950 [Paenibacillus baekrokdamisoli]
MSKLKPQSYDNHKKFVPLFHFVLAPITIIIFVASIVHLFTEQFSYSSLLIFGISLCIVILGVLVRQFATNLQDRSIVQEENFRHFQLTGKPLDARLTLQQIIALRFEGDESFPALCLNAAEMGMEPRKIKQSITHWRADHLRV